MFSQKKMMPLDQIVLDPKNVRRHDEKNIKAIMKSLERSYQRKPVVLYGNTVIAGNCTVEAARRLGWKEIWVNDDPFESEEAAKAYAIADNRSAELGTWDFLELEAALADLETFGISREDLSFEELKWDNESSIDDIEPNLEGIKSTIKVKCPQEIKDEVLIFLKGKIMETSFEGVEVV